MIAPPVQMMLWFGIWDAAMAEWLALWQINNKGKK